MDDYTVHGGLILQEGSFLAIEDGREMLVGVREGCAWITQQGDGRDVVLRAGERYRIERSGCTLVHALRGGKFALASPYREGYARRIDLFHPGTPQAVPVYRAGRGWAVLKATLQKAWVGPYASPPRRLGIPV